MFGQQRLSDDLNFATRYGVLRATATSAPPTLSTDSLLEAFRFFAERGAVAHPQVGPRHPS
jgi:hypothetical protein